MKITLCGSIAFYKNMLNVKLSLERLSHEVKLPPSKVRDKEGNFIPVEKYYQIRNDRDNELDEWIWERKKEAMILHFEKIVWGDKILVTNYDKNGISNYIGANTLIEMGIALYLNKGIYLLNPIPEINYKEEILGMHPIIINQDLTKIK